MWVMLTIIIGTRIIQVDVPAPYRCEPIAAALVVEGYAQVAFCSRGEYVEENGE